MFLTEKDIELISHQMKETIISKHLYAGNTLMSFLNDENWHVISSCKKAERILQ